MSADLLEEKRAIRKNKVEVEKGIAKTARLVHVYFDEGTHITFQEWVVLYNTVRDTTRKFKGDEPVVKKAIEVFHKMGDELKAQRCS